MPPAFAGGSMTVPDGGEPTVTLFIGDSLDVLRTLPAGIVDCVLTSRPYWWLRDYGLLLGRSYVGIDLDPSANAAEARLRLSAMTTAVHRGGPVQPAGGEE
jgi:hypothetical protein